MPRPLTRGLECGLNVVYLINTKDAGLAYSEWVQHPIPKAASRAVGCVFVPFFVLGLFFGAMMVREAIASAALTRGSLSRARSSKAKCSNRATVLLGLRISATHGPRASPCAVPAPVGPIAKLFSSPAAGRPAPAKLAISILAIRRARCSNGRARTSRFCSSSRSPCSSYSSGPLDSTASYFLCSRNRAPGIQPTPLPAADSRPHCCL
jgi:hypothetical protein